MTEREAMWSTHHQPPNGSRSEAKTGSGTIPI